MRALVLALLMVLPTTAWADFQFLPATATAAPRFYFSGSITEADGQEFIKAFQSLQSVSGAVIQLESDGGEAITSLDIADIVRRSGLHTWVPNDKICASSCSMIWIAGGAKYAGRNAHIGFHGAYNARSGQQVPLALAMQGALLGHLDYSYEAHEVLSGGRTAGEKRRAGSASTAAISRSSDQGFAALRARSRLCRAGRRPLPRTGSASGP